MFFMFTQNVFVIVIVKNITSYYRYNISLSKICLSRKDTPTFRSIKYQRLTNFLLKEERWLYSKIYYVVNLKRYKKKLPLTSLRDATQHQFNLRNSKFFRLSKTNKEKSRLY